jgi:hypothetical protein
MTKYPNFNQFGNSAWIPTAGAGSYDSLESVHDQIHGTVGGTNYGDMSVIAVSAFDPSFWFHHWWVYKACFEAVLTDEAWWIACSLYGKLCIPTAMLSPKLKHRARIGTKREITWTLIAVKHTRVRLQADC